MEWSFWHLKKYGSLQIKKKWTKFHGKSSKKVEYKPVECVYRELSLITSLEKNNDWEGKIIIIIIHFVFNFSACL
jgi:hypothetical protein